MECKIGLIGDIRKCKLRKRALKRATYENSCVETRGGARIDPSLPWAPQKKMPYLSPCGINLGSLKAFMVSF